MDKITKEIIGFIVYIALLAYLVVAAPKAMSLALGTPYPMAAITSSSMWPSLKAGDLVFIKGVRDASNLKIGDIIVYRNNMGFTIHRVISVQENTITTKGDANNLSDVPVKHEEVVGKAMELFGKPLRIPELGNISIYINRDKISY